MHCWVYIMGSEHGRAIYIGVTNDLLRRVQEHKTDVAAGFTKRYKCHKLLYCERFDDIRKAIEREKQLKGWRREKKELLIVSMNPAWKDLSENL